MSVLDGLDVFVAICEEGSIAAAGRRLGVPRATLSRQLSRLEAELGVRLLHRTTRRLVRTQAGDELYQRGRRVVDLARAAREAVRRQDDVPRGLLRVSGPPRRQRCLRLDDRAVRSRLPRGPDRARDDGPPRGHRWRRFDVALRAGAVTNPNLITKTLVRAKVASTPAGTTCKSMGARRPSKTSTTTSVCVPSTAAARPRRTGLYTTEDASRSAGESCATTCRSPSTRFAPDLGSASSRPRSAAPRTWSWSFPIGSA